MDEQQAVRILKKRRSGGVGHIDPTLLLPRRKNGVPDRPDREEAEDVVQSAFLHACDKIDQVTSVRFGPWFLRNVINAAIKAVQKKKKQVSLSAEVGDKAQSFEDLLLDKRPSPETWIEMDEFSKEVWQALQLS